MLAPMFRRLSKDKKGQKGSEREIQKALIQPFLFHYYAFIILFIQIAVASWMKKREVGAMKIELENTLTTYTSVDTSLKKKWIRKIEWKSMNYICEYRCE